MSTTPRSPDHPREARLAREVLARLERMGMPPTPPNFMACYNEIAGIRGRAPAARASPAVAAATPRVWRQLAGLLHTLLAPLGLEPDETEDTVAGLVAEMRMPSVDFTRIEHLLETLSPRARAALEARQRTHDALLALPRLILKNIAELGLNEKWLQGQVEGLVAAIEAPLDPARLDSMERRLHDVISRQGQARRQAAEAHAAMRGMIATFVASLAAMNQSSTVFQQRMEDSAARIARTERVEDLAALLQEVIGATRAIAEESATARDQVRAMQARVAATEATLARVYEELEAASAQARHDPLTDTLNRKGLEDALAREIAAMRRRDMALSVCLLDIDNFKKLNDRLGHAAGDQALIHLASVARRYLRPTDTLARYGGEEFVILMPDTALAEGIAAIVRLQRSLTKEFFLAGAEKVLITFSAGVAQCAAHEEGMDAVRRADQAMYQAKAAGKNRVIGA